MLRALRQPRYVALTVLMVIVAGVCIAAGTWQIARLAWKAGANDQLRHNAHAPTADVAAVLPLVATSPGPSRDSIEFRTVTATGTYDPISYLVRQRSVNSDTGFLVMSPFHTDGGVLLTIRGFISATTSEVIPTPPAPPAGQVTIVAHIEPSESRHDDSAQLAQHQLESINAPEQAASLGVPVFYGYGNVEPGQPGVGSLVAIPKPDLSNPAGGAVEPQHLAYIIQWYLFAALALAAPVAMVRAETRIRHETDLSAAPVAASPMPPPDDSSAEQVRAAKLADRYGRAVR